MRHNYGSPRRGVTLIELMIVVSLISLVSALAMPKINMAQYRADDSVRAVRTALQLAQRMAITRQYDVIVSFDTIQQRVRIVDDLNNNYQIDGGERTTYVTLDQGVKFHAPPVNAGLNGPVSAGVTGNGIQSISGLPSIVFLRSGSASSNVELYLSSAGNNQVLYRAVQVTQSTGRTVWYRSLRSVWTKASV